MLEAARERRHAILLAFALAAATLLSFWPVLAHGFLQWDDQLMIVANPHLRGWSLENLRWSWRTFHMGPYQPLSWMSLAVDHSLWGLHPAGYHLTNLLLHTAGALLFYAVLLKATHQAVPAFLGAILFAVHPLRVESVAWATERRDVLSGCFFMAGWLAYLRAHHKNTLPPDGTSWPWASFVFYVAAMLSKVSAAGLIWLLVLSDLFVLHRLPLEWRTWGRPAYRRVWLEKCPFFLTAAALAVVGALGAHSGGYFFHPYSLLQRLLLFIYGSTFYVEKTFIPWGLSPLYSLPLDWRMMGGEFAARAVLFLAVSLWLLRRRPKDPFPAFAWLTYLLLLLPVSGIAQNGRQIAADRYTYLACLPLAWLAADRLARNDRLWPVLASSILIFMGITWRQCGYWKNDNVLWSRAIAVDPANRTALYNLGTLLMGTDPQRALNEFLAVLKLDPEDADAHYNAACLYGRTAEALPHYLEALRLQPAWAQAMNNLALVYMALKNYPEAMKWLNRALGLDEHFAEGRFNRGVLFMMEGHRSAGQADLSRAIRERPDLRLRLGKK